MGNTADGKVEVVRYFMSSWWGVCSGPVDKLLSITINEKKVWSGALTDSAVIKIDDQDIFGGVKKEGGVMGSMTFLSGKSTQKIPTFLAANFGKDQETMPAHRGITSVFFSGGVAETPTGEGGDGRTVTVLSNPLTAFNGASANFERGFYWRANYPQVPEIEIEVQRSPKGLISTKAMIGNNANPIHCVYEVLTDEVWGIDVPASDLDTTAFTAAATTVFDEGIGISLQWTEQQSAEEFINELLGYVNAVLYPDPTTGKTSIKLIRGGYSTSGLFEITPSNAKLSAFQRKMWGDTINELVISYTDPETEEAETVTIQDLGNIAMQGAVVSETRDYKGLRSADDAITIGKRDMRVAASPLASCKATVDREAYGVVPGDAVLLTWPEHGMSGVPMRVSDVDYGEVGDSAITLSLMEDIFALNTGDYYVPTGSDLSPTEIDPRDPQFSLATTLPYHLLKRYGVAPSTLADPEVRVGVMAADASADMKGYVIKYQGVNAAGATVWKGVENRTMLSRATLSADLAAARDTNNASINTPTVGQGFGVGSYAFLGTTDANQEICVVTAVSGNTVTLQRGMMDTTPKTWPSGAAIWFVPLGADILDDVERDGVVGVTYRLITTTSKGTQRVADATGLSAALTRRPHLPLRPANFKIENSSFGPVSRTSLSSLSLTWANRNRTLEDSVLLKWNDATVTLESGVTTTIRVYAADQTTLLTEINGLTGTSYTLPTSVFGSASVAYVRLYAKNSAGDLSLQSHVIQVTA